jgi:hypothetical protein
MTLGITFSINFPDCLNLVICNWCNAKTSFLSFQAFHSNTKINQTTMFFTAVSWTSFSHFLSFFQKWSIWGPLQNPMGAKMASKICQVVPKWHRGIYRRLPRTVPGTDLLSETVLQSPSGLF